MNSKLFLNIFFLILINLFFLKIELTSGEEMEPKVYHGTLNLALGNKNGMVVITDSRATVINGQGEIIRREDDHQKLFPVTKDVVISIAGYNNASVPEAAREFVAPAAGIIMKYIESLKRYRHTPDYKEVISGLIFLLNFHLTSVTNINDWSNLPVNPGNYLFQMLIIGRQEEQRLISKVTLKSEIRKSLNGISFINSNVYETKQLQVGSKFIFETAGLDYIARDILQHPEKYSSFPVIKSYASKQKNNNAENITLSEMVDIAKTIMKITSDVEQGVGGPHQLAIFDEKGMKKEIGSFRSPSGPTIEFNLFVGFSAFGGTAIASESWAGPAGIVTNVPALFIASTFENSSVNIDRHYFFGSIFKKCKIILKDNVFSFNKYNTVEECELILGKRVNMNAANIRSLISDFKWQKIHKEKQ